MTRITEVGAALALFALAALGPLGADAQQPTPPRVRSGAVSAADLTGLPRPMAPRPVRRAVPVRTYRGHSCADMPAGMVCVTAGSFVMGSRIGDADEMPLHRVFVSQFLLDTYEVSFGDYMKCVYAQRCKEPRYYPPPKQRRQVGKSRTLGARPRPRPRRRAGPRPSVAALTAPPQVTIKVATIRVDPRLPVAGITWQDARNYCSFVSKHLPTEAQWEYAARGALGNYYAWGSQPLSCKRSNYEKCGRAPKPVASLPQSKSPFGAHNMTGNVWEWVWDWYDKSYYSRTAKPRDPTGPANALNPQMGTMTYRYRVLRGGSWSGIPNELRTSYRYRLLPQMYANDIGFRCARSGLGLSRAPARVPTRRLAWQLPMGGWR